jgi:NAD(P) transhydrogenase subunit beta
VSRVWIDIAYLIASVLFIYGLKGLTKPRTAVRGNLIGAIGMLIAIVVTLFDHQVLSFGAILAGLVVGSIIGVVLSIKIRMESMPEMVALLNGLGGAGSFLVAGAEIHRKVHDAWTLAGGESAGLEKFAAAVQALSPPGTGAATAASGLIGAVTLSGSLVAFAKLAELKFLRQIPAIPQPQIVNIVLGLLCLLLCVVLHNNPAAQGMYWLLVLLGLALGYSLTIGIGGADMPVVIALLNSYSGLAASATGFVLQNNVLIIAGSLVGASGVLLTKIMCDAMNRSLPAVLFGTLGPKTGGPKAEEVYANVKATSADEIAMLLDNARRVVIVPGYGMAVAQAQHAVRDLAFLLRDKQVEVEFGIHPVAGRMPGHMNVLLAEADIPYDLLKEMDDINPTLEQTDVCLVVGANDTVNPDARTNPNSPIAGMPIINADKARTCVIVKRSLSPGFAGIPNPLFAGENSLMYFASLVSQLPLGHDGAGNRPLSISRQPKTTRPGRIQDAWLPCRRPSWDRALARSRASDSSSLSDSIPGMPQGLTAGGFDSVESKSGLKLERTRVWPRRRGIAVLIP